MKFILLIATALFTQVCAFAPLSVPTRSSPSRLFSSSGADFDPFESYESGQATLAYKDTVKGDGDKIAEEGDVLTVSFIARLYPEGQQFAANEKFAFKLGGGKSMPGFDKGLIGTSVGSKRTLRVPPGLAFGPMGYGNTVPGNADLEYDVEVNDLARGAVLGKVAEIGLDRIVIGAVCIACLAVPPLLGMS